MEDRVAVLIPVYEPEDRLAELLQTLTAHFAHIVVVDDGSTRGFPMACGGASGPLAGVTVLRHDVNRGKGVAIRTGVTWIRDHLPSVLSIVTADADGQHLPQDICRIAEVSLAYPRGLVLGARAFEGDVPFRSRLGNGWARFFFRLVTGLKVTDTQTGLRGLPKCVWSRILATPGDRYEFELAVLSAAGRDDLPPIEVPITTVYLSGNRSSHYRPLRDTLRTQWVLWRRLFGRN